MSRPGTIVLVDDDLDDEEMIRDVLRELAIPNPLLHFDDPNNALQYLKETTEKPFLILSDVNMPGQDGIAFKRKIDADPVLRSKSIPFIFFSTAANKEAIDTAYKELTVQGFFQKSTSYEELLFLVKLVVDYWSHCHHPHM